MAPGPLSCPPGCLRGAKPLPGPQPRGPKGARLGPAEPGGNRARVGSRASPGVRRGRAGAWRQPRNTGLRRRRLRSDSEAVGARRPGREGPGKGPERLGDSGEEGPQGLRANAERPPEGGVAGADSAGGADGKPRNGRALPSKRGLRGRGAQGARNAHGPRDSPRWRRRRRWTTPSRARPASSGGT